MTRNTYIGAIVAWLVAAPLDAGTVVLKRAWVEKYKDRATIDADMFVDDAHKNPNTPAKDSDLHFAGRSKQVGLPMVAEMMNAAAAGQAAALKLVQAAKQTNQTVAIRGAWRLWFEHPPHGGAVQTQKFTLPAAKKGTNPDHVFEIHPVTAVENEAIGGSLVPIVDYETKDARQSFARFKKLKTTVTTTTTALTVQSPQVGFNYVEFEARARGTPKKLEDGGRVLLVDALADDGEVVAPGIRLIFIPNTAPAESIDDEPVEAGDTLHLLGIPRVNLNALHKFAYSDENDGTPRQLPFEMIIVGLYDE